MVPRTWKSRDSHVRAVDVSFDVLNCERSELSNPGSILMMCVRMYVRMYVSVTLRNVAVTSRRNVASMMRISTPSIRVISIFEPSRDSDVKK